MLYKEQEKIVNQIKNGSLVPLGTGTGKTIISLYHYFKNYSDYPLLVIAPSMKVKEGGWERELKLVASWFNKDIPKYIVVSYDRAKHLKEIKDSYIILDEAHYVKNPTAKRSKICLDLIKKHSIYFLLLTATAGSKIEDFANYFIMWGFVKNKTDFYRRYTVQQMNNWLGFLEITGYKNTNDFYTKLKSKSTDKLLYQNMGDVPDLAINYVDFKASKLYKSIKKTRVYEDIPLDTIPHLCSKLRQYCTISDKLEYLKLLVDTMNDNDNLLIFYNFQSEYDNITKTIHVDYVINGKQSNFPKKEEFYLQKGKITLVQIQAGGTGIELQYNNLVVFYSPTYSFQNYEQALGRAYRKGQTKKVQVFQFKTLESIEEEVWECLEKKQNFEEKLWTL